MTKASIAIPLLAFAMLFLAAGCATVREDAASAAQPSVAARSSCPEAGAALKEGAYAKLRQYLSAEMRERITQKRFDELRKQLLENGDIVAVEFSTAVSGNVVQSEIWNIRMVKPDGKGNSKTTEKTLRLMTGTLDGRRQIMGLLIQ